MFRYSSSSVAFPSPVRSESTTAYASSSSKTTTKHPQQYQQQKQPQKQQQQQQQQRTSDCSTAMGLDKILHHSPVSQPPRRRRVSPGSRYHLHIRQQPIAARACGAGNRDRRPVDPPPIVQMLLSDFDPRAQSDLDILQDPRFTVGCLLFPVLPPGTASSYGRNGERRSSCESHAEEQLQGQSTPLLSGKAFVSPFYVNADPDPSTAPIHPSPHQEEQDNDQDRIPDVQLPSPLQTSKKQPYPQSQTQTKTQTKTVPNHKPDAKIPSTFFIFSDLSTRTAGLYRLRFQLINWGHVEDTGQQMPVLAEAWTEPFRVYPAKDFPGMRDSSPLAEGLKELGFVELKTRGKGKGKGRRR